MEWHDGDPFRPKTRSFWAGMGKVYFAVKWNEVLVLFPFRFRKIEQVDLQLSCCFSVLPRLQGMDEVEHHLMMGDTDACLVGGCDYGTCDCVDLGTSMRLDVHHD